MVWVSRTQQYALKKTRTPPSKTFQPAKAGVLTPNNSTLIHVVKCSTHERVRITRSVMNAPICTKQSLVSAP